MKPTIHASHSGEHEVFPNTVLKSQLLSRNFLLKQLNSTVSSKCLSMKYPYVIIGITGSLKTLKA
jgi:hypothetical protein